MNNSDSYLSEFLTTIGSGREVATFRKKQIIFAQGDAAGAVFYIRVGRVRHTVVSRFGKEATLDIFGKRDFFGFCGLAGLPFRMCSATAMTDCTLLQIDNEAMMLELNRRGALSDLFVGSLLERNIRNQEHLVDHIFDSSEMRLARVLLLLADFGKEGKPKTKISEVSHETLAEMAGTTRLQVRIFMNRFRKSGFIAHGTSGLQIQASLLSVVLQKLLHPNPGKQRSKAMMSSLPFAACYRRVCRSRAGDYGVPFWPRDDRHARIPRGIHALAKSI
jgi:CRP/FNR family transcriptional regulator, cyclic AMP receptor protein